MNQTAALNWRKQILLYSMIAMLAGLLFSRFFLSISLTVFIVTSLIHKNFLQQFKNFFASPILWLMTMLFFIPLISGLWSEDIEHWSHIIRIKLPLLLLPICFANLGDFKFKDWEKIAWLFIIVVLVGCGWSMYYYLQDIKTVHAGYLRSHTITTPMDNDHVRFSLLACIAIFTSIFLFIKKRNAVLFFIAAILAIYLHVLAVRTGLVCFYISLFIFLGWLLWNKKHLARSVALLIVIISLPIAAYFLLPTFKNRVRYFNYDISFVKKNVYLPGSNDGIRVISIKGGWDIQQQNSLLGVGFGDVENKMNEWYATNYPRMIASDKILPSNEWIMYGAGAGWLGFILFTVILLIPFFVRPLRKNIFWWMINLSIVLTYLFDNGLEGQLSVFVHAFILLWWYKWLNLPKEEN